MSFSEKTDINCDYNEIGNVTEDENDEKIENHLNYKKDSQIPGRESFKKLKKVVSHVGLLIALMLYTASGGLVCIYEKTYFCLSTIVFLIFMYTFLDVCFF